VCPHFVDGILLGLDTNVSEDAVLRVEQFAKALEEQHVGGQLALVFVFDAEEHVVVGLIGFLFVDLALRLVEVDSGVLEVVFFHPHRIEDGLVQSGFDVAFAEHFSLVECVVDELDSDVLLGAEVLLDLVLAFVPHVVLDAEIQAEFLVLFVDIPGETVDLDVFKLLEVLDLLE